MRKWRRDLLKRLRPGRRALDDLRFLTKEGALTLFEAAIEHIQGFVVTCKAERVHERDRADEVTRVSDGIEAERRPRGVPRVRGRSVSVAVLLARHYVPR